MRRFRYSTIGAFGPSVLLYTLLRIPSFFEPHWYTDEAGYATTAREMLRGKLLYVDIWNNKPPLHLWTVAAIVRIFGSGEVAFHLTTYAFGLLTLGAVLSVLGTNNNTVLSGPRYLYALAESGRLPSAFARIHPVYRTPYVALLTQTGVALSLIGADALLRIVWPGVLGLAEELAVISTVARLATYIGTCLAVPVLRRKLPSTERTLRLPGGPTIPILGLAICLLFLSAAEAKNWIAGGVALLVGAAIYYSRGPRSASASTP